MTAPPSRSSTPHAHSSRAYATATSTTQFGGHTLHVKDNRLHYAYNFVGMLDQHIVATEDIPTGENLILSASFEQDGEDPPSVSTGS